MVKKIYKPLISPLFLTVKQLHMENDYSRAFIFSYIDNKMISLTSISHLWMGRRKKTDLSTFPVCPGRSTRNAPCNRVSAFSV